MVNISLKLAANITEFISLTLNKTPSLPQPSVEGVLCMLKKTPHNITTDDWLLEMFLHLWIFHKSTSNAVLTYHIIGYQSTSSTNELVNAIGRVRHRSVVNRIQKER